MTIPGKLIVMEGPDGVGKTTLAQALTASLQKSGSNCMYYAFPGRKEGTLGQLIYRLHHQPAEFGIDEICPASLQILHVAAHVEAIERFILPALDAGTDVVLDRFWWSTWVYGMADNLDVRILDALLIIEAEHWRGRHPRVGFLISRAEPLRREISPEAWATLCRFYDRIAIEQSNMHPIYRIVNKGTVSETLMSIAEHLTLSEQII